MLGLAAPFAGPNGSGDRGVDYAELPLMVVVALVGTIAWSILDRRRRSYPRLAAAAWVMLRYYLAAMMFSYGISKVLKLQYPGSAEACAAVTKAAAGVPWAVLSAGVDHETFIGQVRTAIANGASGAMAGRSLWKDSLSISPCR